MPTLKQRVLALLATGRIANVPTVATHVIVALLMVELGPSSTRTFGIGFSLRAVLADHFIPIAALCILVLALLLYIGGCLLGDGVDAAFDSQHRPDRPIPQGILSARAVSVAGWVMIGLAWFLGCLGPVFIILASVQMPFANVIHAFKSGLVLVAIIPTQIITSTVLALSIVIYAKYHKSMGIFAPILMALCRAFLVIWVAGPWSFNLYGSSLSGILSPVVLTYALCTFLYTLTLSLVARNESNPDAKLPNLPIRLLFALSPLVLAWSVVLTSGLVMPSLAPTITHITLIIFSLLYLAWCTYAFTRLKHSIPAFVSAALAGFCLMDACFAALIGWQIALLCLALFLLALLLQRIAPAT